MQRVHNYFHGGMICSRSICHVSVLNLNVEKLFAKGKVILIRNTVYIHSWMKFGGAPITLKILISRKIDN